MLFWHLLHGFGTHSTALQVIFISRFLHGHLQIGHVSHTPLADITMLGGGSPSATAALTTPLRVMHGRGGAPKVAAAATSRATMGRVDRGLSIRVGFGSHFGFLLLLPDIIESNPKLLWRLRSTTRWFGSLSWHDGALVFGNSVHLMVPRWKILRILS